MRPHLRRTTPASRLDHSPSPKRPLWTSVVPLAALLASCGTTSATFPHPDTSGATVGGVIFVDNDEDGLPGKGDEPVAGVRIEPLTGSILAATGAPIFGPDPNTESTVSNDDGSFWLTQRVEPNIGGIELSIDAPVTSGRGAGELNRILRLEAGTERNAIALPSLPRDCTDQSDCGAAQLPDLMPITSWDQLDEASRARLKPAADAPPIEQLLPPYTWFVESTASGSTLLRFSSVTANVGSGPLDVIANRSQPDGASTTTTWQRLWTAEWNYIDRLSGSFLFHEDHDHIHFDEFERYRLIGPAGRVVAESAKVSFCLRDSLRIVSDPTPTVGPFGSAETCGANQQSINVGYADHYHQFLPDQWIDVTGIAAGEYLVEITVDPANLLVEEDETNNVGTFAISLN